MCRPEDELKRNAISIRLGDDEHHLITETAYRNRQSVSEMVREMVIEKIKEQEAAAVKQAV
jgi:uncharacterized protein (DUF1778 family)